MKNLISLSLLALGMSALAGTTASDTDVIVVGADPAGIGAALCAAKTVAKTVLLERFGSVGGTTVSAEVTAIDLFHAWKRQVIAGPCWDFLTNLCARGYGRLPDASKQNGDRNCRARGGLTQSDASGDPTAGIVLHLVEYGEDEV